MKQLKQETRDVITDIWVVGMLLISLALGVLAIIYVWTAI